MKRQQLILYMLLSLSAVQVAYYYPQMPDTVASHFGANGRANGWMSKDGFIGLYAFMMTLMAAMFAIMPRYILKFPDSMINLPAKGYWLAPERRAQTGATIQAFMLECGNATIALMLCIFQLAFQANLGKPQTLGDSSWVLLAAFLGYMAVWLIRFYRAFRPPPGADVPKGC